VIVVVSANYAAYDTPKPPPPGADEYYLFSDGPPVEGWTMVRGGPPTTLPPRYRAKAAKVAPWLYGIVPADADVVWMDHSLMTTGEPVTSMVEAARHEAYPLSTFRHRMRDCLFAEAEASDAIKRYDGENVLAQAQHYRRRGHPAHAGLWETGALVWLDDYAREDLGARWLAEMLAWSSQDQVSLPWVTRDVGRLSGSSVDNAWFKYQGHTRQDW